MSSSTARITLFKEAMRLEEQRSTLQAKLSQTLERLDAIKAALFSEAPAASPKAPATVPGIRRRGRAKRGALKKQILDALAAAGDAGVRVTELAASLGAKPGNIHSWFQVAKKSMRSIRRIGPGRYRMSGASPSPKAPAAKKPAAIVQKRGLKKSGGRTQRGHLTSSILGALQAAGKDGVRVSDLAKRFGVHVRNLFVWFSTTGRKHKGIKKVAPGIYRLQG